MIIALPSRFAMKGGKPWYTEDVPKVLVYGNRKQADMIWPFTTEDEKRAAILALFLHLDESWECYAELDEHDDDAQATLPGFEQPSEQREQRALLLAARGGDSDAAWKLLDWRRDYEYEEWRIVRLQEL